MKLEHLNSQLGGVFTLQMQEPFFDWPWALKNNMIHIIWNNTAEDVPLQIDGLPMLLQPQQLLTTTYYHQVEVKEQIENLVIFSFNRAYYCIYDHDTEVSCNGIIFFGAQKHQKVTLDSVYQKKLSLLLEVFKDEFGEKDNIQGEMLVVLLKRLIIICTRLAKNQSSLSNTPEKEAELIRQFNFLVDMHYKEYKTVKEYADLLFKSPKTLSNAFSKAGASSPLQIIHERVILEARRLLIYTDKNINEIAFELGFDDPGTFFRLFKKQVGESPQNFRINQKKQHKGNLASL